MAWLPSGLRDPPSPPWISIGVGDAQQQPADQRARFGRSAILGSESGTHLLGGRGRPRRIRAKFFVIGVVLALWACTTMVGVPLVKGLSFLLTGPQLQAGRARGVLTAGAVPANIWSFGA